MMLDAVFDKQSASLYFNGSSAPTAETIVDRTMST